MKSKQIQDTISKARIEINHKMEIEKWSRCKAEDEYTNEVAKLCVKMAFDIGRKYRLKDINNTIKLVRENK